MKRIPSATQSAAVGRLAAVAALVLLAGCDALERELPMETVITWPEIAWEPVPPEHEPYVPDMTALLQALLAQQERVHAEQGEYTHDLRRPRVKLAEGMTWIVESDRRFVEIIALHAEAPGSGCIVRLGERRLTRYTDDPKEVPSPAFFAHGLRLPDVPGEIECMRMKSRDELRPRITRRRL